MYHYYTCGNFLHNEAALRRVPCNCEACDTMIRKPWKPGLDDYRKQPRFQNVDNCYFSSVLGDENRWHFVNMYPSKKHDHDDEQQEHYEALQHITALVADEIEVGNVGAVVTSDTECKEGYYLVEFTGEPYTDQQTGELKCECNWLYPLPESPSWYTFSTEKTIVELLNVVATNVEMDEMSPNIYPRNQQMRKECRKKNGKRITNDARCEILDEIIRRDDLEYDPTIDYIDETGYETEDTGSGNSTCSNSEEEDESDDEED